MKLSVRSLVPFTFAVTALALGGCGSPGDGSTEAPGETTAAATLGVTGAPVLTKTTAVFPAKLAASKNAGVASVRLTRVGTDLHLEELGASGQSLVGFVLHPVADATTKKVTSVSITRIGAVGGVALGSTGPTKASSLAAADRAALANIGNELSGYDSAADAGPKFVADSWWGAIGAGIACGLAAVEGGANPLADADCAIAAGEVLSESEDDDDDVQRRL